MRFHSMDIANFLRNLMSNRIIAVLLRLLTIARVIAWVFSVVVCGSLISGGYENLPTSSELKCILNDNKHVCACGVALGIFGCILCIFFLLLDIFGSWITNHLIQKSIIIADATCSVIVAVLWLIVFCFISNEWAKTSSNLFTVGYQIAQITIACSFFSILSWVGLSYLTISRSCFPPAGIYKHTVDESIIPVMDKKSFMSTEEILQCSASTLPATYSLDLADSKSPSYVY